jgi:hypothetical protein
VAGVHHTMAMIPAAETWQFPSQSFTTPAFDTGRMPSQLFRDSNASETRQLPMVLRNSRICRDTGHGVWNYQRE